MSEKFYDREAERWIDPPARSTTPAGPVDSSPARMLIGTTADDGGSLWVAPSPAVGGGEARNLHAAIMNIPCRSPQAHSGYMTAYNEGHRSARHAAAELALTALNPPPREEGAVGYIYLKQDPATGEWLRSDAPTGKVREPAKTLRMLTDEEKRECKYKHYEGSIHWEWRIDPEAVQRAFFAKNADELAGFVLGEEAG